MVMLSENQIAKVRAALEKGYIGTCDVIERVQTTGANHAQTYTETVTQKAVPCRLSFASSPATDAGNVAGVAQAIKLFYPPDVTIKTGSKLLVTQNGVTTAYQHTGREAVYASHKEAELDLFERWA